MEPCHYFCFIIFEGFAMLFSGEQANKVRQ